MAEEEKSQTESKQQKGIVSTQQNDKFFQEEEKVTIMPTMIDDSEIKDERKRDISAIIPKDVAAPTIKENELSLTSKEKELKSDGAVVLASVDGNIEVTYNADAVLPEQIDIEERKIELQKSKNRKRGVKKKDSHKKEHQIQNIGAIIALIAIAIIGGAVYYYFNHATEQDFVPLTVTVELGDDLPIRVSSYVKPGVGTDIDEMDYIIDKTEIIVDKVGTYNFYVTHAGVKKTGKLIIQDTTPPDIIFKDEYTILEGTEYDASKFIEKCNEQNGCEYYFQDPNTTSKYKTAGLYTLYIVAEDIYHNKTTKRVTLIIESQANVKKYIKKTQFDFNKGYETLETYELHLYGNEGNKLLREGVYTIEFIYNADSKYYEDKPKYNGDASYKFDDATLTITKTETVKTIGNGYNRPSDIDDYLKKNGFEERG